MVCFSPTEKKLDIKKSSYKKVMDIIHAECDILDG